MSKFNCPLFFLHAAKEFFEKGTLAAAENFMLKKNEDKKFDLLMHPKLCMPIMNIAFSLEIVLKGLHKQAGQRFPRTHDILKLFQSLDKTERAGDVNHPKPERIEHQYHFLILDNHIIFQ